MKIQFSFVFLSILLGSLFWSGLAQSASPLISLTKDNAFWLQRMQLQCGEVSGIGTYKQSKVQRILAKCPQFKYVSDTGSFGVRHTKDLSAQYGEGSGNYLDLMQQAKMGEWLSVNTDFALAQSTDSDSSFMPKNAVLSVGSEVLQVDVGWREHWYATSYQSSFMFSNQAESLPSITFANNRPLAFAGLEYEFFLSRQSYSTPVKSSNQITEGYPYILGTALSFTPVKGVNLSLYRVFQFAGGEREVSGSDLVKAFFDPRAGDNVSGEGELGNQLAGFSSAMHLDFGENKAIVHAGFFGEDTEGQNGYRLGNVALTGGVSWLLPGRLQPVIEFEHAQWDSAWYAHHIYPEGLTINHIGLGHWFTEYAPAGKSGKADQLRGSIILGGHQLAGKVRYLKMIDIDVPVWVGQLDYAYRWRAWQFSAALERAQGVQLGEQDHYLGGSLAIEWSWAK